MHANQCLFHFLLGGFRCFRILIRTWVPAPEKDVFCHVRVQYCYIQIGHEITRWCLHRQRPISATPHTFAS